MALNIKRKDVEIINMKKTIIGISLFLIILFVLFCAQSQINLSDGDIATVSENNSTSDSTTSGSTMGSFDLPQNRPPVAWSGTFREINNEKNYIKELKITKAETNAHWRFIEKNQGVYDFEQIHSVVDILKQDGVKEISLAIYPENPLYNDVQVTQSSVPQTEEQWTAYKNFLTALVNDFKNDVQFYQVIREINLGRFLGTPEDYAKFLVFSSNTIKSLDPQAKIIFAALPYELCINSDRNNFLADTIQALPTDKKYFDAIDIHLHRLPENSGEVLSVDNGDLYVAKSYDFFTDQLSGTAYKDSLVFFETSSYTAEQGDIDNNMVQTEQQQAQDLEKRLEVLAQKGVYWINLEGGISQRPYFMFNAGGGIQGGGGRPQGGPGGGGFRGQGQGGFRGPRAGLQGGGGQSGQKNPLKYFEYTGLIWNPEVNDGKSGKKKAFDLIKEWNNE